LFPNYKITAPLQGFANLGCTPLPTIAQKLKKNIVTYSCSVQFGLSVKAPNIAFQCGTPSEVHALSLSSWLHNLQAVGTATVFTIML
jgi:hypothetical protein